MRVVSSLLVVDATAERLHEGSTGELFAQVSVLFCLELAHRRDGRVSVSRQDIILSRQTQRNVSTAVEGTQGLH